MGKILICQDINTNEYSIKALTSNNIDIFKAKNKTLIIKETYDHDLPNMIKERVLKMFKRKTKNSTIITETNLDIIKNKIDQVIGITKPITQIPEVNKRNRIVIQKTRPVKKMKLSHDTEIKKEKTIISHDEYYDPMDIDEILPPSKSQFKPPNHLLSPFNCSNNSPNTLFFDVFKVNSENIKTTPTTNFIPHHIQNWTFPPSVPFSSTPTIFPIMPQTSIYQPFGNSFFGTTVNNNNKLPIPQLHKFKFKK